MSLLNMYLLRIPWEGVQGEILESLHKIEHGNAVQNNVRVEATIMHGAIIACELAPCGTMSRTTMHVSREAARTMSLAHVGVVLRLLAGQDTCSRGRCSAQHIASTGR